MKKELKQSNIEVANFSISEEHIANSLLDYTEVYDNGIYFYPPINPKDLISLLRKAPYHASAISAKVNILTSTFKPTKLLSRIEFEKVAFNFIVTGNAYLETIRNRLGQPIEFKCRLSAYMRRASDLKNYILLDSKNRLLQTEKIDGHNIAHITQPDLTQEIYGMPYYLSCIDSIELNKSATRFRRRYYDNGSHAGFILYATDAGISTDDWNTLKKTLKESKGDGNFRNVFLHSPNGNKDGLQLMPISEIAAKDDFLNIKTLSSDDMLAIHRVPPKLMGLMPKKAGSLGSAETDAKVFAINEIFPLQQKFKAVNDQFNAKIFEFDKYEIGATSK